MQSSFPTSLLPRVLCSQAYLYLQISYNIVQENQIRGQILVLVPPSQPWEEFRLPQLQLEWQRAKKSQWLER